MKSLSASETRAANEVARALREIDGLEIETNVPLAPRTRFAVGGLADLFAETSDAEAFAAAALTCRRLDYPCYVLGEGSNVIVSDRGFRGLALRLRAAEIRTEGRRVRADAGASLQALVDSTIEHGLSGLHTLVGIPGSVGGAVYGNAGAYGRSIDESVESVRIFDSERVRELSAAECEFAYRESVFKRRKDWVIFSCTLVMARGERDELRREADRILALREEKFPATMRCAGSIFKNLHVKNLPAQAAGEAPPEAVRGGKIAAAFFLDKVGAKGMRRGGIEIASYHANLIYNAGGGTAAELRELIEELKRRVSERYGFELEEEVQYVGEF